MNVLSDLGYIYSKKNDKWLIKDLAVDYIHIGDKSVNIETPNQLGIICYYSKWKNLKVAKNIFPDVYDGGS